MNQQLMEKIPLFTNEAIIITPKDTVKFNKTATLQPWDQSEFNPFLVTKYHNSKQDRRKISSLDYAKFRKKPTLVPILLKQGSKQLIRPSKQLPKLNIGLSKPTRTIIQKKSKTVRQQIANNSPKNNFTPNNKKDIRLQQQKQLKSHFSSSLLPTVSRQLNITRKIFLLQSKISGVNASPSPQRKKQGTLRKLIEKQWQKKV